MKVRVKPSAVALTIAKFPGDASHAGVRAGILARLDGVAMSDEERSRVRAEYQAQIAAEKQGLANDAGSTPSG